jgi:hypothetical protein
MHIVLLWRRTLRQSVLQAILGDHDACVMAGGCVLGFDSRCDPFPKLAADYESP